MKKIIIIALGLGLVAGLANLRAADEPAKKGDKASREARQAELLKKYDKNHDGKLDDEEKAAMKEDLKKRHEKKDDKGDKPKKEESK